MSHLLSPGYTTFRGLTLESGPGAQAAPQGASAIVERALAQISTLREQGVERPVVVDLNSGSGEVPLAIALEAERLTVHAVERYPVAAQWACRNLSWHDVLLAIADSTVSLHIMDIADLRLDGVADLVTCADPGETAEERNVVANVAARLIKPGGVAIFG